jgi:RNA polymerase sigma factor (sigma-70 family)
MGKNSKRWSDRAGDDVVAKFVIFQKTAQGFDEAWAGIGSIVNDFARMSLTKRGVMDSYEADPWAVDDVVNQTALTLMGLAKADAKGRFDPDRARPGISGLRGWLWRVVDSQAINWVRDYRCGRAAKFTSESDLAFNELPSGDQPASFLDRQVAKMIRPDVLPLLNACIDRLPEELARLVRLRLHEDLSQRDTAKVTGISAPVVCRRLHDAYDRMRQMLEEAGFDEACLAA